MAMKAFVAAALLLVLSISALAQAPGNRAAGWSQFGGGPLHSGVVDLGDGDLDVIASGNVAPVGQGLVDVLWGGPDNGLVGLALTAPISQVVTPSLPKDECQLIRVPLGTLQSEKLGQPFACNNGAHLLAFLPSSNVILVGVDGLPDDLSHVAGQPAPQVPGSQQNGPLAQAFSAADGSLLWGLRPTITVATRGANNQNDWFCDGAAADEARNLLILGCANDTGNNVVQAFTISDRRTLWSVSLLPSFQPPAPLPTTGSPPLLPAQPIETNFSPESVTMTADSVILKGMASAPPVNYAAMVWLNLTTGQTVGDIIDGTAPSTAGNLVGSAFAASDGARAAAFVGRYLYRVDPRVADPNPDPDIVLAAPLGKAMAPAWSHRTLFAPLQTEAYVVSNVRTGPPPLWYGFNGGTIGAVLLNNDREAWVSVAESQGGNRTAYDVVRVALPQPFNLQHIPLPIIKPGPGLLPHLLPVGDARLLAYDAAGNVALLGKAPDSLRPNLDYAAYPAVGEAAVVHFVDAPDARVKTLVGWGDGQWDDVGRVGSVNGTYIAAGDAVARLTFVFANGTTATRSIIVHVGQREPHPNPLEILFRPENQNYTFFGIGLFLTLFGALFAAIGASRGRRRLARYLRQLDSIHESGRGQPFEATRTLHDFRESCRLDLAKGRLDNAQFTVIESRANEVLQLLRQRVLGSFLGRTSEPFNHALDLALLDGGIDPAESKALVEAVGREKGLGKHERESLAGLVRSWTGAKPHNAKR